MSSYAMYEIAVSEPAVDANATGVKLRIPVLGSMQVVEFGAINDGGADANATVLALQYVDGSNNTAVNITTATGTAAFDQGKHLRRSFDLSIDKANDKFVFNGTETTDAQGLAWLQINATTGGDASSTATYYIVYRMTGAQAVVAETNEVIVTS